MKHIVNRDAKKIVLDSITREFLGSLGELRIMHGLTQSKVSEITQIKKQSISQWERGIYIPIMGSLMVLADLYGADISVSLNYQYWHGQIDFAVLKRELSEYGLTQERLSILTGFTENMINHTVNDYPDGSLKCLSALIEILSRACKGEIPSFTVKKSGRPSNVKLSCLDEITVEFLRTLKARRVSMGLSQNVLARMLGVSSETIRYYEKGQAAPTIRNLMKLARILGYDISESINSQYNHGEICYDRINSGIRDYGLTYSELGRMTNYHKDTIRKAVLHILGGSLKCLSDVIDVLDHERESSQIRDEICHAERKKKPGKKSSGRRV